MRYLAEFEIISSRSGHPTVVHVPSNTLIHSRINPCKEAQEIVEQYHPERGPSTVIIGGGLGYLVEAVLSASGNHQKVFVVEPNSELRELAYLCRADSEYVTSERVTVVTAVTQSALSRKLRDIPLTTEVIVSPYLMRLTEHTNFPMGDYLRILRAEHASRHVYDPLLSSHGNTAAERLAELRSALSAQLLHGKLAVVIGAGPSLNACLDDLVKFRSRLSVLAASGAVPALLAARVVPDWVFALEAKDTVLNDLSDLPLGANVVVFSATHPNVILWNRFTLIAGTDPQGNGLETRGGSSVIPAVDFALKAGNGDVVLLGMDLSYHNGAYAEASKRKDLAMEQINPLPPKFLSMRAGLERILLSDNIKGRTVFHVLSEGMPLRGTQKIGPEAVQTILSQRYLAEVQRD